MSEFFEDNKSSDIFEGLTVQNINPAVVQMQYGLHGGALAQRAATLKSQLTLSPGLFQFDEIVDCSIGSPQSSGQRPLTFHQQVLSLALSPRLLKAAAAPSASTTPSSAAAFEFAPDAIARAQRYVDSVFSVGAYTKSQGNLLIRQEVAAFIAARDGENVHMVDPDHIFLTNGASEGVRTVMQTIVRPQPTYNDGLLIPVPQSPLYSALLTLLGGTLVPYYLDDRSNSWKLNLTEVEAQFQHARKQGVHVRGIVVINPGNPTGFTLNDDKMKRIVSLCAEEGIVLLADEVYQENIYEARSFHSFRKTARSMGFEDRPDSGLNLVSFHSISKGFVGECGIRGGYFECFGFDEMVLENVRKLSSISLCPDISGQLMTGLVAQPPMPGDASYSTYDMERSEICNSLQDRATRVSEVLNALPGISCPPIMGALYAFPRLELPLSFNTEANERGVNADELYCRLLLEATGVLVEPGSVLRQQENTFHFRITILPPAKQLEGALSRIAAFQVDFMRRYEARPSHLNGLDKDT